MLLSSSKDNEGSWGRGADMGMSLGGQVTRRKGLLLRKYCTGEIAGGSLPGQLANETMIWSTYRLDGCRRRCDSSLPGRHCFQPVQLVRPSFVCLVSV